MDTQSKKKSRAWFFTYNNYAEDIVDQLAHQFGTHCEKYVFQEETGEKGTPHLQGVVRFKNARYLGGLKKLFGDKIHWELCKDWNAAVTYCSKDETRSGKICSKGIPKPIVDLLDTYFKKYWQKHVIEIVQRPPDDRTIYWFTDVRGGAGKTTLAKHLCLRYEALYISGGVKDMKYGVASWLEEHGEIRTIIMDLCRTKEEFVSYEGIESVKNGIFFNTKYESKMVIFNSPHVIVFANFLPDLAKLSKDRWKLYDIDVLEGELARKDMDTQLGRSFVEPLSNKIDNLFCDENFTDTIESSDDTEYLI